MKIKYMVRPTDSGYALPSKVELQIQQPVSPVQQLKPSSGPVCPDCAHGHHMGPKVAVCGCPCH